jgi:hypothetical protein
MKLLMPLLLVVGVLLMVPFESTITRILGVAALIAFVVCGVFAIATPEYLSRPDEE